MERDGYAWCIRCHTNRQSAKCKRCKKPVTDLVVSALGSEWHNSCFSCSVCEVPDSFKELDLTDICFRNAEANLTMRSTSFETIRKVQFV